MLKVVKKEAIHNNQVDLIQAYKDHNSLISAYINSYKIRNYSKNTIKKEQIIF